MIGRASTNAPFDDGGEVIGEVLAKAKKGRGEEEVKWDVAIGCKE